MPADAKDIEALNIYIYKNCIDKWIDPDCHCGYCVLCATKTLLNYIRFIKMNAGHIYFNSLRPRQNGRHFADAIFKCIFLNENVWIPINISMKFVPKGPINNIPALVQIMAWRCPGDKPLSEPMMVSSTTHIYASLGLNELTGADIFRTFKEYFLQLFYHW